ncbi:alpha-D-glucose phosphate-specific phosphoglucomutase [Undibacterium jejuense]|uniref:Alpha-D-glucose phosphate-specific phosphoglucomutase n=1 Tax=Undibacterium jejuense TaxID=1344949 RepID=A0A923HG28_9BURK|nr:alpha-D-glucose phosphate-specific phosphoglucomutase [Undibacterium jejuense]MBC3863386.1 alpha-D-glucose phosphate-specific phosphoglucomutase [Undibacterium jejuense]
MWIHPLAGKPVPTSMLVNIPRLVAAYYTERPDVSVAAQAVIFGTSGHRGSSLTSSFNEWHLLAIAQAICDYRAEHGIHGPLYLGIDTHALSIPAQDSVLQVLVANGVTVLIAPDQEYTPTPAISLAILAFNHGRQSGFADGIVISPSHNPPEFGGLKYNTCQGDGADIRATNWIENKANEFLRLDLHGIKRVSIAQTRQTNFIHYYDFLGHYVDSLCEVLDINMLRHAALHIGVDPMGGAGVHYWERIAEQYALDLDIIDKQVDERFAFMTLDWDGKIRLDPASGYAMQRLIQRKADFDVAFGCDTDHDRHGIVTPECGLMPPNHFLVVAIDYLFQHRPAWNKHAGVGKNVVCTQLIDRVSTALNRDVYETPVGFKWFGGVLYQGALGFAGEESAGATLLRRDGSVWTTDKDGIVMGLLAAEILAATGISPGTHYQVLSDSFGHPDAGRVEGNADAQQRAILSTLHFSQLKKSEFGGEQVLRSTNEAQGNHQAINGLKVITENAWFVIRPSGTEDLYKIYAESFLGKPHLESLLKEVQSLVIHLIS